MDEPKTTSLRTLLYYEAHAASFRDGTLDHDVSQNIEAILGAIEGAPPFRILDLGCGPGRDLASFLRLGHEPVGLDGCAAFCRMAREATGCEVLEQDFLALSLPEASFDGVFANASLFHVPSAELPGVLASVRRALRPRGVLFSSNPRGDREGWNGERYGSYVEIEAWRARVVAAGFEELGHYYRPPGLPRSEQAWLASLFRRVG